MIPIKIGSIKAHLNQIRETAKYILETSADERFFTFVGEMGSGKTTLIQALAAELGSKDIISSPTYSLVNEYAIATSEKTAIFHFDFYRIEKLEEVYDMGYEEYFYSSQYCLIEWPEKITPLLPENYIEIGLSQVEGDEKLREITIFKH